MKIDFNNDEAWELMSFVVARLVDEATIPQADKAKIRRWRSEVAKPGSETMRLLTEKINRDVNEAIARKRKSAVQKPDWR